MCKQVTDFQIRGVKEVPYHLSVGLVVLSDGQVAVLRKKDGSITLPRETCYLQKSLGDCLKRGAREELGLEMEVKGCLGSLISFFNREDNSRIEKTTLYFWGKAVGKVNRNPESDEIEDIVLWLKPQEALQELREANSEEFKILERFCSVNYT